MLSYEILICLIFCPAFFTIVFLCTAILHIFELGKSKSRIKKERKNISFVKKVILWGYIKKCEYHAATAKTLCFIYWGYILTIILCTGVCFLAMMLPEIECFFTIFVIAKVSMLDIPINVYSFIMTRHNKKIGGVTWAFNDKNN